MFLIIKKNYYYSGTIKIFITLFTPILKRNFYVNFNISAFFILISRQFKINKIRTKNVFTHNGALYF